MSIDTERGRGASFAADLRYALGVLRARALLIALCVLCAGTFGFMYARSSPKIYAAKTVIQIEQEEPILGNIEGAKPDLKEPQVLKTYEQNITTPEVLLRVVKTPGLMEDPAFLPEVKPVRSVEKLQAALAGHVTATIRRETRLIDVTVEDQSPAMAQRIAELLVGEFALWNSQMRREAAEAANRFLHERAHELSERLAKSERAIQAYKELHGEVSFRDKQGTGVENLNQLSLRIAEARTERLKLQSDAAQIVRKSRFTADELLTFPSIASAPAIVDLRKRIGDREALIAPLKQRYKDGHPTLIAAQAELEELRAALVSAAFNTARLLNSRLEEIKLTEEKLKEALREQQRQTLGEDAIAIDYSALNREAEANRVLYEAVLKRMKEIEVTKDIAQNVVRVVARPLLPGLPVKPKKTLILALSIFAGLGLGGALALALHFADASIRTSHDAGERLGLRVLSEIPRIRPPRGSARNSSAPKSDFAAVEAFRVLRTSLSLADDHANRKSILFTSAEPAEGKTFCAINCAISFAQAGLKTLLIDAGYRAPRAGAVLFDGAEMRGVEEAKPANGSANGNANGSSHSAIDASDSAIRNSHIPNLSILSAHLGDPNSVDFLGGDNFEKFMRGAAAQFDRIIVDGAPVNKVSDTLLFARHVQSVCLVILAGQTPAEKVLRAVERLTEAGAPLVGFVWNQAQPGAGNFRRHQRALPASTARELLS